MINCSQVHLTAPNIRPTSIFSQQFFPIFTQHIHPKHPMSPTPTEEELQQIAAQLRKPEGEQGIEIGELMNQGNGPMNRHTIAVLDPQPHDVLLEIGMGNGYFARQILNQDPSIQYTGCDYSEWMVQAATELNQTLVDQGRAKFVHANVQQMPFEDQSFTKIFTVNTFYFWDDHEKVAKELKRVLKAGGHLIVSVRPKHNLEDIPVTKYNFAKFSKEEMVDLFQGTGFSAIEITEIKEPEKEGALFARETLILNCQI